MNPVVKSGLGAFEINNKMMYHKEVDIIKIINGGRYLLQ